MQPLVDATLARWFTEPFRKNKPEIVKPIGQLIASTPVAGYIGCCHAISKLSTTARLKDIKGRAGDHRRAGRGGACGMTPASRGGRARRCSALRAPPRPARR